MKFFKKLKTSKGMKILRIVEVVVVLLFTAYIVYSFLPMTKELMTNIPREKTTQEESDAIQ